MNRPAVTALVAAATVALVVTACGTSEPATSAAPATGTPTPSAPPTPDATPEPTPTPEPAEPSVQTVALTEPISHVHGLVVDAEGSVRAGTHDGVRAIGTDGTVTAVGPQDDLMGMTGLPGTMRLVSSGHPGPGSPLPNPVGLIRSDDGGATWESVSLAGQIDFHALAVTEEMIVGFDGVTGLVTSTDGGATWQQGAPMAAVSLAAVGDEVWATTPEGVMHSTDRGASFDPLDDAPLLWQVSAGTDGSLWGVDTDGLAWRSTDGREWTQHQKLPAVEAITALDHATAYALNGSDLLILTA
jgi:hypothetical protein